jgi:hypothetical protein
MAPSKDKLDHPLIQSLMNPSTSDLEEGSQPIIINPKRVHELLEEQAAESLRGQISDKPRWSE